jgi:putative ubiquitin-RnfH superfamily antitoxin RatB of RatAB toxin-antitoxin module
MDPGPEASCVEVVYASPARQRVVSVPLTEGLTALDAVRASGILEDAPEIDPGELALGIWGRRVDGSQRLRADDRVEIYRPLRRDPREARRQAAGEGGGRRRRRDTPRVPR